jgi:hypothetical protein
VRGKSKADNPDVRARYEGCRVLKTPIAYPVFLREYETSDKISRKERESKISTASGATASSSIFIWKTFIIARSEK